MPTKYPIPECLRGHVSEQAFSRWLNRKAQAHMARDRKRGMKHSSVSQYKQKIYSAIQETNGADYYTASPLDWGRISQWNNTKAALKRGEYKKEFWDLPTVDHENPQDPNTPIRLCSWRVNDSKNDQTIEELLTLADKIRTHLLKP